MALASGGFAKFKSRVIRCVQMIIEANEINLQQNEHYYKINIDFPDRLGRTPLHLACLHGLDELVKYLLDKGADH